MRFTRLTLALAGSLLTGTLFARNAPVPLADNADDHVAQSLLRTVCAGCHDVEQVTDARHDSAGWDDTLKRMISHGAAISPDQAAELKAYLVAHYSQAAQ